MSARRIRYASLLSVLAATALAELIVIRAENTYWRMQIPQEGQSTISARVETLNWNQDTNGVTNTIANFFNEAGTNIQLWREGGISSLLYYGLATSQCLNVDLSIEPQAGLSANGNALTIILPSGVQALQRVGPDPSALNGQQLRSTQGIFGINGNLSPVDYAYATSDSLKEGLRDMVARDRTPYPGQPIYASDIGVTAVRGDGVEVLIQLTIPGLEHSS